VVVTVLEASGSVLDANLLGSKNLFLFNGLQRFCDLFLTDASSSEYKLQFSFDSVIVLSNFFTVFPFRFVYHDAPFSPLLYSVGLSYVSFENTFSVSALDGTGSILATCGNQYDIVTLSILELGGIVPTLSGVVSRSFSGGTVSFPNLKLFKEAGTHFYIAAQLTSSIQRAGMEFFATEISCCHAITQQFSIQPFSYLITTMPSVIRYPDDSVFVTTSVVVTMIDGSGAVLENAGQTKFVVFVINLTILSF
jgi:hypothetical protein